MGKFMYKIYHQTAHTISEDFFSKYGYYKYTIITHEWLIFECVINW